MELAGPRENIATPTRRLITSRVGELARTMTQMHSVRLVSTNWRVGFVRRKQALWRRYQITQIRDQLCQLEYGGTQLLSIERQPRIFSEKGPSSIALSRPPALKRKSMPYCHWDRPADTGRAPSPYRPGSLIFAIPMTVSLF